MFSTISSYHDNKRDSFLMWIDTLGKLRFDCAWSSTFMIEINSAIHVLCRDGNFSALQTLDYETFQRPALSI